MNYYRISFGNNARTYLYKSERSDLDGGKTVIVPVKNGKQKMGIIVKRMRNFPDEFPFPKELVREILKENKKELEADIIKNYLLSLIQHFMDGDISRHEFAQVVKGLTEYNRFCFEKETEMYGVFHYDIPALCRYCVDGIENEVEQEYAFRKEIKKLRDRLWGSTKFSKELGLERHDPVEKEEYFQRIELDIERKVKQALVGVKRSTGYCHLYWNIR